MSPVLARRAPALALLTFALVALGAPARHAQAEDAPGSQAALEHVYLQLSGMG